MKNKLALCATIFLTTTIYLLPKPVSAQAKAETTKPPMVDIEDNPGRNPLELSLTAGAQGGWTVPSDKRYVIEQYSIRCDVDDPEDITDVSLNAQNNGKQFSTYTVAHKAGSNGSINGHQVNGWSGTGVGTFYVEPGSQLFIQVLTPDGGASVEECEFTIMGHIIRKP